jgi:predicted enzyme related to lactoylglutathione lyase
LLIALATPLQSVAGQGPVGEPGSVRWFDLLTEDAATASAFYGDLFGWDVQRQQEGRYLVIHEGELIAGISQIESTLPEISEATWLIGVVVDDLQASVDAARRLNGRVLKDVTMAENLAHWAVIEDPQGGQLLLLDPVRLRDLGAEPGPGHLVWTELWTTDVSASSRFYSDVVGWDRADREHTDGDYALFETDGEPRAGLVAIETEEIDTGWAPYIGVDDLDATLVRARELGGEVVLEPSPDLYDGLVAVVVDPTGVGFLIYQFPEEAP